MVEQNRARNPIVIAVIVTVVMAIVAIAVGVFATMQIKNAEHGLAEAVAKQQDGYVQLVIDQINTRDDRDDDAIVSDILQTLDASPSKYWAFSRDQTMLFVRDDDSTYNYKGFSAATFWSVSDVRPLIDGLELNSVKHDFVTIEGKPYVASGARFSYGSREYNLCLFTSVDALLSGTSVTGAFGGLTAALYIALALLFIVPTAVAWVFALARKRADAASAAAGSSAASAAEKPLWKKIPASSDESDRPHRVEIADEFAAASTEPLDDTSVEEGSGESGALSLESDEQSGAPASSGSDSEEIEVDVLPLEGEALGEATSSEAPVNEPLPADALPIALEDLLKRGAKDAFIAQVSSADQEASIALAGKIAQIVDDYTVHFRTDDNHIVILFSVSDPDTIRSIVEPMLSEDDKLNAILPLDPSRD